MCGTHTGRARPRPLGYKLIIACPDGLLQLGRIRVQPLPHVTGSVNIPLASTQHGEQTSLVLLNASEFARLWRRSLRKRAAQQHNRRDQLQATIRAEEKQTAALSMSLCGALPERELVKKRKQPESGCSARPLYGHFRVHVHSTRLGGSSLDKVAEDQGRKDESAYRKARP